jgi:hypothetical protein
MYLFIQQLIEKKSSIIATPHPPPPLFFLKEKKAEHIEYHLKGRDMLATESIIWVIIAIVRVPSTTTEFTYKFFLIIFFQCV